jgi:protein-tyrosine phosphatase
MDDCAPEVKDIPQVLEHRAPLHRFEGLQSVVLCIIGIGRGGAVTPGDRAGLWPFSMG